MCGNRHICSLCGPLVFVDPRTREAITRDGPATLPDSIGIANTSVDWNGRHWTMVMWPLPQNVVARRVLLAHESFHRLQKDLGLPRDSPPNAHLDGAADRTWMRLEWRALARALATRDREAVAAALAFRAKRNVEEERLLEMNEGLAEYTGFALAARLWKVEAKIPPDGVYAEGPLWNEEKTRAAKKLELMAPLRRKFIEAPVLTIPLRQMEFKFDPNRVQPFGELGTVYPSMEVRDVWGKIVVSGGGLISADYSRLVVPASGEGYELTLNEGWKIVAGDREGDKTVSR
jgi:hypothetical protein